MITESCFITHELIKRAAVGKIIHHLQYFAMNFAGCTEGVQQRCICDTLVLERVMSVYAY